MRSGNMNDGITKCTQRKKRAATPRRKKEKEKGHSVVVHSADSSLVQLLKSKTKKGFSCRVFFTTSFAPNSNQNKKRHTQERPFPLSRHQTISLTSLLVQKPLLAGFDGLQHGFWHGAFGIGISGRIIFALRNVDGLDLAVDSIHGKALASSDDPHRSRSWVRKLHFNSLCEFSGWVSHELQHGRFDLLVLRPGLHDGCVIHTVHDHSVNSSLAECVLVFQITWNLPCGSGGSEGTG